MSSSLSTAPSTLSPHHPQVIPATCFNNMDLTTEQSTQQSNASPDVIEPWERSTGRIYEVTNKDSRPPYPTRSVHMARMKNDCPKLVRYYDDLSAGKIAAKSFARRTEPASYEYQMDSYQLEHGTVRREFFTVDYNRGFTGRGVSPDPRAMERPGLIGPLGEMFEDLQIGEEGGNEESPSSKNVDGLIDVARQAVSMISGAPANTGNASLLHAGITSPVEPELPLSLSSPSPASWDETVKEMETKEDGEEGESAGPRDTNYLTYVAQQGMSKIPTAPANTGNACSLSASIMSSVEPQLSLSVLSVSPASTPRSPSGKRARDAEEENTNDDQSISRQKRRCTDNVLETVQDGSKSRVQGTATSSELSSDIQPHSESPVEEDPFDVVQDNERRGAYACEEAVATRTEWTTAHGINSDGASLIYTKCVYDRHRGWAYYDLALPKCRGSPNRPWTEEEKEDLRVYIQDYGIGDWALLSESMSRTEKELMDMFVEVIVARNRQAGRPARAGIPKRFPNMTPPPPPEKPTTSVPMTLPLRQGRGRNTRNSFGDFKYSTKATAFPKVTRGGVMVDSKGYPLSENTSGTPHAAKRRQIKLTLTCNKRRSLAEDSKKDVSSRELLGEGHSSLNRRVIKEEEYGTREEECEREQQSSTPTEAGVPESSAKPSVRLKFTGVKKLLSLPRRRLLSLPRRDKGRNVAGRKR